MKFFFNITFFNYLNNFINTYKSPSNFSYFWNFGSLCIFFLILQVFSGIFLSFYYTAESNIAFFSIDYIMIEINNGWFFRYLHANGATFFFFALYIHIFKNFFFSLFTYPKKIMWLSGIFLYILIMATAFLGYVLPWGQMSYWAAKVITTFFSTIPYIGDSVVEWLWGSFSVSNITLHRFFSLHYLLPFLILMLTIFHLIFLHEYGSGNPLGVIFKIDFIPLNPFYTLKDLLGILFFLFFLFFFIFFSPNYFNHSDNYILANPDQTPEHIVPEWYFLFFYAILRSVPNKTVGILLLVFAIFSFLVLPFFFSFFSNLWVKSGIFNNFYNLFFWIFFLTCCILSYIGCQAPESPYYEIGQFFTIFFFFLIFIILPFFSFLEYVYVYIYIKKYY